MVNHLPSVSEVALPQALSADQITNAFADWQASDSQTSGGFLEALGLPNTPENRQQISPALEAAASSNDNQTLVEAVQQFFYKERLFRAIDQKVEAPEMVKPSLPLSPGRAAKLATVTGVAGILGFATALWARGELNAWLPDLAERSIDLGIHQFSTNEAIAAAVGAMITVGGLHVRNKFADLRAAGKLKLNGKAAVGAAVMLAELVTSGTGVADLTMRVPDLAEQARSSQAQLAPEFADRMRSVQQTLANGNTAVTIDGRAIAIIKDEIAGRGVSGVEGFGRVTMSYDAILLGPDSPNQGYQKLVALAEGGNPKAKQLLEIVHQFDRDPAAGFQKPTVGAEIQNALEGRAVGLPDEVSQAVEDLLEPVTDYHPVTDRVRNLISGEFDNDTREAYNALQDMAAELQESTGQKLSDAATQAMNEYNQAFVKIAKIVNGQPGKTPEFDQVKVEIDAINIDTPEFKSKNLGDLFRLNPELFFALFLLGFGASWASHFRRSEKSLRKDEKAQTNLEDFDANVDQMVGVAAADIATHLADNPAVFKAYLGEEGRDLEKFSPPLVAQKLRLYMEAKGDSMIKTLPGSGFFRDLIKSTPYSVRLKMGQVAALRAIVTDRAAWDEFASSDYLFSADTVATQTRLDGSVDTQALIDGFTPDFMSLADIAEAITRLEERQAHLPAEAGESSREAQNSALSDHIDKLNARRETLEAEGQALVEKSKLGLLGTLNWETLNTPAIITSTITDLEAARTDMTEEAVLSEYDRAINDLKQRGRLLNLIGTVPDTAAPTVKQVQKFGRHVMGVIALARGNGPSEAAAHNALDDIARHSSLLITLDDVQTQITEFGPLSSRNQGFYTNLQTALEHAKQSIGDSLNNAVESIGRAHTYETLQQAKDAFDGLPDNGLKLLGLNGLKTTAQAAIAARLESLGFTQDMQLRALSDELETLEATANDRLHTIGTQVVSLQSRLEDLGAVHDRNTRLHATLTARIRALGERAEDLVVAHRAEQVQLENRVQVIELGVARLIDDISKSDHAEDAELQGVLSQLSALKNKLRKPAAVTGEQVVVAIEDAHPAPLEEASVTEQEARFTELENMATERLALLNEQTAEVVALKDEINTLLSENGSAGILEHLQLPDGLAQAVDQAVGNDQSRAITALYEDEYEFDRYFVQGEGTVNIRNSWDMESSGFSREIKDLFTSFQDPLPVGQPLENYLPPQLPLVLCGSGTQDAPHLDISTIETAQVAKAKLTGLAAQLDTTTDHEGLTQLKTQIQTAQAELDNALAAVQTVLQDHLFRFDMQPYHIPGHEGRSSQELDRILAAEYDGFFNQENLSTFSAKHTIGVIAQALEIKNEFARRLIDSTENGKRVTKGISRALDALATAIKHQKTPEMVNYTTQNLFLLCRAALAAYHHDSSSDAWDQDYSPQAQTDQAKAA